MGGGTSDYKGIVKGILGVDSTAPMIVTQKSRYVLKFSELYKKKSKVDCTVI